VLGQDTLGTGHVVSTAVATIMLNIKYDYDGTFVDTVSVQRSDYVTACGFPLIPGSGRYVG